MSGRARLGRRDRVLALVMIGAAAAMTPRQWERARPALLGLFGSGMRYAEPRPTPRVRHTAGWQRCPGCRGPVLVDCVEGVICGPVPERADLIAHCADPACAWEDGPERELEIGRPHVVQHLRRRTAATR